VAIPPSVANMVKVAKMVIMVTGAAGTRYAHPPCENRTRFSPSRPVFLPFKPAPPIWRQRGFARQSEGRHNILYFAAGKVCAKGAAAPLETPEKRLCLA